jgi:hypothetical protein
MKKLLFVAALMTFFATLAFVGCEKEVMPNSSTEEALSRRGGRNNGGSVVVPSTSSQDSLFNACGMAHDSVNTGGIIYPTIQLPNLRSRHETRYSYSNSGVPYAYDLVIIEWDNPIALSGSRAPVLSLLVSPCPNQPCTYTNGLLCSQVICCIDGTNRTAIYVAPGTTSFYPNPALYTAYISIFDPNTGCTYVSQRFTYEPNKILPQ